MQELELKRLAREAELAVLAEEASSNVGVKGGPELFSGRPETAPRNQNGSSEMSAQSQVCPERLAVRFLGRWFVHTYFVYPGQDDVCLKHALF